MLFQELSSTSPPIPSMRLDRVVPTSRPLPQPLMSSAHFNCHHNYRVVWKQFAFSRFNLGRCQSHVHSGIVWCMWSMHQVPWFSPIGNQRTKWYCLGRWLLLPTTRWRWSPPLFYRQQLAFLCIQAQQTRKKEHETNYNISRHLLVLIALLQSPSDSETSRRKTPIFLPRVCRYTITAHILQCSILQLSGILRSVFCITRVRISKEKSTSPLIWCEIFVLVWAS